MTKFVTISEASVILGVSERTIWRKIRDGSLEGEIKNGRRMVRITEMPDNNDRDVMPMSDNTDMIEWLKNELSKREKQILFLQEEVKQLHAHNDEMIARFTEELEAQRCLFQGLKVERKGDRSFWKFLKKPSGDETSDS